MTKRLFPYALTICLLSLAPQEAESFQTAGSLDLRGDFLYWRSKQDGLDYTTKPHLVFTTTDFSEGALTAPNFAWEPGYRLSAIWSSAKTPWSAGAQAVRYRGRAHGSSKAGDTEGIFPTLSFDELTLPSNYATSAKIDWRLHTTLLDVFGAYRWYTGNRFSFMPSVGVRNAWISQHVRASYRGATFTAGSDHIRMRSHFYGVGPQVGLEPRWYLNNYFSLYLKGAGTLLFGWFNVHQKETFLSATVGSLHRNLDGIRWGADAIAGASWVSFCDAKAAIKACTFDIGFDYLYFSKQYAFEHGRRFSLRSQNKNLILYGVHASAGLQF